MNLVHTACGVGPNLFDLSKEIILITGASLGLGRQFRQRRLGALRI
jgi:hypothetical protein